MNIVELSNHFCINYFSCLRKIASSLSLTQAQALCLQAIPFNGISQSDLANKLSIDLSTLSRNLNKLIKLNVVKKIASNLDKRSYRISLTAKGRDLYQQFNRKIYSKLSASFDLLSLEENNQLEELLNKLNWQLELLNK